MKSAIDTQINFYKEFQEHAKIQDILFLSYCLIIPFFHDYTIIFIFFYSMIGLFYIKDIIDFRKQQMIYSKNTKPDRKIIE